MIKAQAKEPTKLLLRPTRKPRDTCKLALAAPTPTTSSPNIIDLAANLPGERKGLLGDDGIDKPSSSKPKQATPALTHVASKKGKERAHPAPELDAASISDEIDTDIENEVETEEEIMERQVALLATRTPPL
jgi:hypothetical protein